MRSKMTDEGAEEQPPAGRGGGTNLPLRGQFMPPRPGTLFHLLVLVGVAPAGGGWSPRLRLGCGWGKVVQLADGFSFY